MNRRTVLSLAAAVTATDALPRLAAARQSDFQSGGLGLPLSAWEDAFGLSEVGQTYMSFAVNDGNFWIGVDGDDRLVDYIERNWNQGVGPTLADVQAEVGSLLPSDASVAERYIANYAQILHGSLIDRYQSRSLGDHFEDRGRQARSFAVIYELVPADAAYDYQVNRYFITVGIKSASGD